MSKQGTWIWLNGDWKPWETATVHVSAHALHYGSSIFEGIRAYALPDGPAVFSLPEHIRRFHDSARLARIDLSDFSTERLTEACLEIAARNHGGACYIRPIAFRDAGPLGVDGRGCPASVAILSLEWGAYLGPEALENGVDAMVSSWRRFSPGSFAPMGKIGGQYVNNQFVSMEARDQGFAEGILLDAHGMVSEGGGENLFLVRDGVLLTPPVSSSILAGITRDAVVTLARDLGLEVRETSIPRDMLYLCDELFMTGTAAEVTPVRSIDRMPIGDGRRGPITRRLQEAFFDIVSGRTEDRHGWLMPARAATEALVVGA
ncbi:MAG: branched-chain amino acid transaminase [Acidobacteriota bacterium]